MDGCLELLSFSKLYFLLPNTQQLLRVSPLSINGMTEVWFVTQIAEVHKHATCQGLLT